MSTDEVLCVRGKYPLAARDRRTLEERERLPKPASERKARPVRRGREIGEAARREGESGDGSQRIR